MEHYVARKKGPVSLYLAPCINTRNTMVNTCFADAISPQVRTMSVLKSQHKAHLYILHSKYLCVHMYLETVYGAHETDHHGYLGGGERREEREEGSICL